MISASACWIRRSSNRTSTLSLVFATLVSMASRDRSSGSAQPAVLRCDRDHVAARHPRVPGSARDGAASRHPAEPSARLLPPSSHSPLVGATPTPAEPGSVRRLETWPTPHPSPTHQLVLGPLPYARTPLGRRRPQGRRDPGSRGRSRLLPDTRRALRAGNGGHWSSCSPPAAQPNGPGLPPAAAGSTPPAANGPATGPAGGPPAAGTAPVW